MPDILPSSLETWIGVLRGKCNLRHQNNSKLQQNVSKKRDLIDEGVFWRNPFLED
jgi:hypothetical protein